jgi:hypothetical protein
VEEMDYERLERHSLKCGRTENEVRKEKLRDENVQNIKKLKKEKINEMRKGRRNIINPLTPNDL